MKYKSYNVFSSELKQKIKDGGSNRSAAEGILKKIHYSKRLATGTIEKALKAGATPNKFLYDAIEKYYSECSWYWLAEIKYV